MLSTASVCPVSAAPCHQVLKNMSVLKMAAAQEPPVPTRLYKPLNLWRLMWMRNKLEAAKTVLGWDSLSGQPPPGLTASSSHQHLRAGASSAPQATSLAFETRVQALAERLRAAKELQQRHLGG